MAFSIFGDGILRSAQGGLRLPVFDAPVFGALQHLFAASKPTPQVAADGFTYVQDAANTGTARDIRGGKALLGDGVDGKVTIGDVGNTKYIQTRIEQAVDNQVICTLDGATTGAVSVVAGVLTFGSAITIGNIYIDGVSKTAAEAGVLLNDNLSHQLYIDYAQVATSNLILFSDGTNFGNVKLYDFRVGDTVESVADVLIAYQNPNYLHGTETGFWHLDEESGTTHYDSSGNTNNGTASGGVTHSTQDVVSFADKVGFNLSGSVVIPADLSDTNNDVLGNILTYKGSAPKNAKLVGSACVTMDGIGDKITAAHLDGTETVVRSGGTSTPTVGVGEITFTAGTCWDLLLSDGTHYPLAETAGLVAYDASGNGNHGTIVGTEANIWNTANYQDLYHNNLLNGYSLYEHTTSNDLRVPYASGSPLSITPPTGYTLTEHRPAGKWHNGAETKFQPNPNGDAELNYRANLDSTDERHNSDVFASPEFFKNQDLSKGINYAVYDKNITSSQAIEVEEVIKYNQIFPYLLPLNLK